jgi:sugar lactone lactonase YvrE
MATVELACDAGCDLGESPVWDADTKTLYFVVSPPLPTV